MICTDVPRRYPRPLLVGVLAFSAFAAMLAAQTPAPSTTKSITVQDGTIIPIILSEKLSSGTNKVNDQIHATVAEDVVVAGVTVVPKGTEVIGHITEAERKGRFGHAGKLSFSFDYVKAADGTNVRLRADTSESGKGKTGALMLGLSGAFMHGSDVTIPKGTAFIAYVDGDRQIAVPTSHGASRSGGGN